MEPILTLPYSEWLVAEELMKHFPSRAGYSVYAPLSRQEKGVDLLLTRRLDGVSRAATLQVKYSRAYEQKPGGQFKFAIWFRSFPVSDQADFFVLATLYPNVTGRGGGKRVSWWSPLMLVFQRSEMAELISSLRTRSGKADRMFYFGFDSADHVVLTRGATEQRDFTPYTFAHRSSLIRRFLGLPNSALAAAEAVDEN
jgi:hypothetical protein